MALTLDNCFESIHFNASKVNFNSLYTNAFEIPALNLITGDRVVSNADYFTWLEAFNKPIEFMQDKLSPLQ